MSTRKLWEEFCAKADLIEPSPDVLKFLDELAQPNTDTADAIEELMQPKSQLVKDAAKQLGLNVIDLPLADPLTPAQVCGKPRNKFCVCDDCSRVLTLTYLIDEGQYASSSPVQVILILTNKRNNEVETVAVVPNSLPSIREQLSEWEDTYNSFQMITNDTSLFDYEFIHAEVCSKLEDK